MSMLSQAFPPKATWGPQNMPDLTGRVAVVTGGYAGIGMHTVKALLMHGAKVYVAGRDASKAATTIAALAAETGKTAHFLHLDLGNLKSIKAAAAELATQEAAVHLLFNNAGVMTPPIEMLTSDEYDLQWGTNVLGHYFLTRQLLPLLRAGAASAPEGAVRVVHTASIAADTGNGKIDFATFRAGAARTKAGTSTLYSQSKLGNIMLSSALARRCADEGIVSISVNPGVVNSELQRHFSGLKAFVTSKLMSPTHFGALTQLWAGTSPEGRYVNGKHMWPWAREGKAPKAAGDVQLQEQVWAWCEEQVKDI